MSSKQLNTINKSLLYSKKAIHLTGGRDHNDDDLNDRTDNNIKDRFKLFHDQLDNNTYYRIPIKYFTELGAQNSAHNINTKITFTLETNKNKLFETTKKATAIPSDPPDATLYFLE